MSEISTERVNQDPTRGIVLVVDDEHGPRESLRMILRPAHQVLVARDGFEAMQIMRNTPVDLVTLDLNMPGIQGEELMRAIRREFPDVSLIIITGFGSLENAAEAIRYGVSDYLIKPFDVVQVSAAVHRALAKGRGRRKLASFLESLGDLVGQADRVTEMLDEAERDPRVARRVGELFDQLDGPNGEPASPSRTLEFLEVLAATVESQCGFLHGHARRTAFYAGMLADRIGLPAQEQEHVRIAGFLHDIGKIGVPTELLTRAGALLPKERALLERHPEIGARLVDPLGIPTQIAAAIRHHHEWWDGRGYGDGLYGGQIPVAARIVGVADAFDAMSCDRPYRDALPLDVIRQEIDRYAGVQFDPELAKEFLLILDTTEVDLRVLADAASSPQVEESPRPTESAAPALSPASVA